MDGISKKWEKVIRIDNVQEYFWIGEFIQSDKWLTSSPPDFHPKIYEYLKDGIQIRKQKHEFDNEISVSEITHATSCECMLSIIQNGGFIANEKHIPIIGALNVVWFGLKIGEKEIDRVKEYSNYRVHDLIKQEFVQTADDVTSVPTLTATFQPMSRYGNFKFTLCIKEVLDEYKMQFCAEESMPEMRKLGTFAYKMETMHVVLVCPPNTSGTEQLPPLSGDPVIEPDAKLETWLWRPHSTRDKHVSILDSGYPFVNNRRWEHVVFAFYAPNGYVLKITNLNQSLSLCLANRIDRLNEFSSVKEAIHKMLVFIEPMEINTRRSLVNTLIIMIVAYLDEEHLYQKTMNLYYYQQHYLDVELELVVNHLRALQPRLEIKDLNWTPLKFWMEGLTRHRDVLRFSHYLELEPPQ